MRKFHTLVIKRQFEIKRLVKKTVALRQKSLQADASYTLVLYAKLIASQEREKCDIEKQVLEYEGVRAKLRRAIRMIEQGEPYLQAAEVLARVKAEYDEDLLIEASMAIEAFDEMDDDLPGAASDDMVEDEAATLVLAELEALRALPEAPTRTIAQGEGAPPEPVRYYM